jgi:hypothetical protein
VSTLIAGARSAGTREHRRDAYDTLGLATCVPLRPGEMYHILHEAIFRLKVHLQNSGSRGQVKRQPKLERTHRIINIINSRHIPKVW